MLLPAIFILLLAAFVAPIAWYAKQAAKYGQRYIGTDDPVARYDEMEQDIQAGRYWKAPLFWFRRR